MAETYCDAAQGTSGMDPIMTGNTASPSRTMRRCSNGSCWRSTRRGSPGSRFSRSGRRSAGHTGFDPELVAALRGRRRDAAPGRFRNHPQPAQDRCCHRERANHPGAQESPRLLCRLARRPSSPRPRTNGSSCSRKPFALPAARSWASFCMSIGYLPGAHAPSCPVYQLVLERQPPWSR